MMSKLVVVVTAALALSACKSKDNDPSAASPPSSTAPPAPPAAGPPPAQRAREARKAAASAEVRSAAPASAPAPSAASQADKGSLRIVYAHGESAIRTAIQQEAIFEKIIAGLNAKLKLSRDIPVVFNSCGQINAFYSPDLVSITMCDELIEYFITAFDGHPDKTPEQKRVAIIGALVFVFLHEVGHALVDQLELPLVGREEAAADQLAALLVIVAGDEGVLLAAHGAGAFLDILALRGAQSATFWDQHALDEQRFYDVGCLIYGSNPDKLGAIVDAGYLPKERALRCPTEYKKIYASWDKLLAPYIRP